MTTREAAVSRPTDTETRAAEVAIWLQQWVQAHGGTDKRDEGGRLHLDCYCGTYLGISYGPRDSGPPEAEALAYFRHQAADMLAAGLLVAPEQPEATTTIEWGVQGFMDVGACWAPTNPAPLATRALACQSNDRLGAIWARGPHGDNPARRRIVSRTIETRVSEWTPVTDDGEGADRG